jgi:hypothetical protein
MEPLCSRTISSRVSINATRNIRSVAGVKALKMNRKIIIQIIMSVQHLHSITEIKKEHCYETRGSRPVRVFYATYSKA